MPRRRFGVAEACFEASQARIRLGTAQYRLLCGTKLSGCVLERSRTASRQIGMECCQRHHGFQANAADRIIEQPGYESQLQFGRKTSRRPHCADAHKRVRVAQPTFDRSNVCLREGLSECRQRRAARYARHLPVVNHGDKIRIGKSVATLVECIGKMRPTRRDVAPPLCRCGCRPCRGLFGMAIGTGVRRSSRQAEVGPRHSEAVIAASVDAHVNLILHVTIDARRIIAFMPMVFCGRELARQMALRAYAIGIISRDKRQRVRIVAIAAADAGLVHAALHEGAVDKHLFIDLTIVEIQRLVQQ